MGVPKVNSSRPFLAIKPDGLSSDIVSFCTVDVLVKVLEAAGAVVLIK